MGKRAAEHGITAYLTVTETIRSMARITNLSRGVTFIMFYGICFPKYFHLENFTIHQIFFRQCVYAMNSPNFPAAKVSLHTVSLFLARPFSTQMETIAVSFRCIRGLADSIYRLHIKYFEGSDKRKSFYRQEKLAQDKII